MTDDTIIYMDSGDLEKIAALGKHLKALRARAKESLAETSGAVEIDVMELDSIERGHRKPAEDILLLLISHFEAKEDEAIHLWEMAGYKLLESSPNTRDDRIIYTDAIEVVASSKGVVIRFMGTGSDKQRSFGMSREHARKLVDALTKALDSTDSLSS